MVTLYSFLFVAMTTRGVSHPAVRSMFCFIRSTRCKHSTAPSPHYFLSSSKSALFPLNKEPIIYGKRSDIRVLIHSLLSTHQVYFCQYIDFDTDINTTLHLTNSRFLISEIHAYVRDSVMAYLPVGLTADVFVVGDCDEASDVDAVVTVTVEGLHSVSSLPSAQSYSPSHRHFRVTH